MNPFSDAIKTLVGEENAKRGTIKMFEVLQDTRLNKHLFYELFLLLIDHMVPELKAVKTEEMQASGHASPLIVSSAEWSGDSKK